MYSIKDDTKTSSNIHYFGPKLNIHNIPVAPNRALPKSIPKEETTIPNSPKEEKCITLVFFVFFFKFFYKWNQFACVFPVNLLFCSISYFEIQSYYCM